MTGDDRLFLEIPQGSRGSYQNDPREKRSRPNSTPRKVRIWQRPFAKYLGFALVGGAFALVIAGAIPNVLRYRSGSTQIGPRNRADYLALQSAGNLAPAPANAKKSFVAQTDYAEAKDGEEQPAEGAGLEAPEFPGPMIIG
jgi:hypothetical protein